MKKSSLFCFIVFLVLSCSSDDTSNGTNILTITLTNLNFNKATITWTRPSNAASGTVLYEIVLNNNVVIENHQNTSYQFLNLQPETNYNVIVTALDTEGKETFDQISFTTLEDTTPPPVNYYGDLIINSQSQMNDFSYKNILGSLTIDGDDITDLSNLMTIEHVSSYVRIKRTSLQNLNGINNIISFDVLNPGGGSLGIESNDLLTDISDADQYLSVARSITIRNNASLQNINGLTTNEQLKEVYIESTPISDLNFLSNTTQITEEFTLLDLPNLSNSSGLNSMLFSGNTFRITNVPLLSNISGSLSSSEYLEVNLIDLPALTNLDILSGINEMKQLRLHNVTGLSNLDGLSELQSLLKLYLTNLQISDLNAFSNLNSSPNNWDVWFYVYNNPNLNDFCGMTTYFQNTNIYFDSWNIIYHYSVHDNAYNPVEAQIESPTECSQ